MSIKIKPLALTLGAGLAVSLATSPALATNTNSTQQNFTGKTLQQGYTNLAENHASNDAAQHAKDGHHDDEQHSKSKDGNCGSCGAKGSADKKDDGSAGKCGAGKCGAGKCG